MRGSAFKLGSDAFEVINSQLNVESNFEFGSLCSQHLNANLVFGLVSSVLNTVLALNGGSSILEEL